MSLSHPARLLLRLSFLPLLLLAHLGVAQSASSSTTTSPAATAKASLAVGNNRYDAAKELPRLTRRYSLTLDQQAKIQPLLLEQQKQIHKLGEDGSLSNAEWIAAVRKVHLQTVALIKHQLTDAQATLYARDEAKWAKSSQGDSEDADDGGPPDGPPPGGGGPGGGGPGGGGPGGGGPGGGGPGGM
ncbi:MAG: hypothetical protein P4K80_04380 [Acidobacteriaceae bacterium]|nr:hypothetical protein [Acidobacteriaceae bacterium]